MNEIKDLLGAEIKSDITKLSSLKAGSDEKTKIIDQLSKLHKLRVEELKVEAECIEKENQQQLEVDKYMLNTMVADDERAFKEAEIKDRRKDRAINVAVQVGLAVIGWVTYDIWYRRGLRFEETGTITSPQTRNLISNMLPKLKR